MTSVVKVLHVISDLSIGGAETALYRLLEGLDSAPISARVASLTVRGDYGPRLERLGIPVDALEMKRPTRLPFALPRLQRIRRSFRPDVIHGWMYHGNLAASLIRNEQTALAWNIRHSLDSIAAEKPGTRFAIRANRRWSKRPDVIVYNSEKSRRQHEGFGLLGERGVVIPNGFDLDEFSPDAADRTRLRSEFGAGGEDVLVGHVARWHPLKDHASFLSAAVRVARELPQVRFVLAGRDVSMENPALSGIVPADLLARFSMLGERSDVRQIFSACDMFCLSSISEGFPNVVGEAMAAALPCVVTDVGDCADIVGATGRIVRPADVAELAGGLRALAAMPADERRSLGAQARERIRRRYSLDVVIAAYRDLYERLASGRGAR